MNPGTFSGINRNVPTYSRLGGGSWGSNRGRLSVDELRMFGYPDGQRGYTTGASGGGAKMYNTNPQTNIVSIAFPGDLGSISNVLSGQLVSTSVPMSAAYNTSGTIFVTQNATNNTSAFEANTTIANYGASAVTIPGMSSVVGGNLYVANGAAVTFGVANFADITSNLAWAATNAGTLAVGTVYNYDARETVVQSGVTITRRSGYHVSDTGTGGTITTQVGLDIPALTGGTTNIGISNLSSFNQQGAMIPVNNVVTVTSNAGTIPINAFLSTFTNSSAATATITMTTTGATDGQLKEIRFYDFSAVAQTITWVNTENSSVTVPPTSNGSTTSPLTVGFQFNSQTSKWRCIFQA